MEGPFCAPDAYQGSPKTENRDDSAPFVRRQRRDFMRTMAMLILFFLAGCSKPPEPENSETVRFIRSDNGSLMQNPGAAAPATAVERKPR